MRQVHATAPANLQEPIYMEPDDQSGREEADTAAVLIIDRFHKDDEVKPDYAFLVSESEPTAQAVKEVSKIWNFEDIPPSAYKDIFENPLTFDEAWNESSSPMATREMA
jgi:hypothetical protein